MSYMTDIVFEPSRSDANVCLEQMLDARERRSLRQKELLALHGKPVISFTMNIAGGIKRSRVISRAFALGCEAIEKAVGLSPMRLLYRECMYLPTGDQAFYVVDADIYELKTICTAIENNHPLGRLFDIDVIGCDGVPVARSAVAAAERSCLICGKPGKECAVGRVHSAEELQERTAEMLYYYFLETDATYIMSLAAKSLRYEAWTTPKPGLVDMNNNGSHSDMDITLLMLSVSVIAKYFRSFFYLGINSAHESPEQTFALLREEGKKAEAEMLEATGGVNTHRGAIFLFGILCGACGRCWSPAGLCRDHKELFRVCSEMTNALLRAELDSLNRETARTHGEKLYVSHGVRGARGSAMDGFPEVGSISLPILRQGVEDGQKLFSAGSAALLHLIANVTDTNIIYRSDMKVQERLKAKLSALLHSTPFPDEGTVYSMDMDFIAHRLSPGGCADLLAITYFVFLLENSESN